MGSMTAMCLVRWKANCERHCIRRARERGLNMTARQIAALSDHIERARAAFVRPGRTRYRIRILRGDGTRLRAIYDTRLCTIVTVWRRPR